jgi:hypothetical protein
MENIVELGMRGYRVPPNLFAAEFPDYDHDIYRRAIGELIDRYDIRNKRVLALGAGSAFEEHWFAERNELTVIDIDEHGSAETALRAAPPGAMRYIVGDVLTVDAGEHDVLYASGFTPDEKRRRDIISRSVGLVTGWNRYFRFAIAALGASAIRHAPWPLWRNPFHPGMMRHARRLTPGGLMIVQSIGYSLDAKAHRFYIPACRLHLALHGMRLLELWRFARLPGVMLYVAQKRNGPLPPMKSPLTLFHARAAEREPIERIYP